MSTALHLTKAADSRSGGFTSQSHLGHHALQWRQSHSAWMVCIAGGEVRLPSSISISHADGADVDIVAATFAMCKGCSLCTLLVCINHAHKLCAQPVMQVSAPESEIISVC